MKPTQDLITVIQLHLENSRGSTRKAAKKLGMKWWDLHDVMYRPHTMSKDRMKTVYEKFNVPFPQPKVYWRPALDLELKNEVATFLDRNPEVNLEDIIRAGMEAAVEREMPELDDDVFERPPLMTLAGVLE